MPKFTKKFNLVIEQIPLFLMLAITVPVYFFGLNNAFDWGDDFAQYIWQAKQLYEGLAVKTSPVVNYQDYCPFQRGAGFSLLLTPIYSVFKLNVNPYQLLLAGGYFTLCIVLLGFYKRWLLFKLPNIIIVFIVLATALNSQVLMLRHEIVPAFIFMPILYYIFYLSNNKNKLFIKLLLIGLLLSIKLVGFVVYLSFVIMAVYNLFHKNTSDQNIIRFIQITILPLSVFVLVSLIVFKHFSLQSIVWYNSAFSFSDLFETVLSNTLYYKNTFKWFFEKEIWGWANLIIISLLLMFSGVGLGVRIFKRFGVLDVFFFLFVFTLILYDYRSSGIRFLVPVLPILILYIIEGLVLVLSIIKKTLIRINIVSIDAIGNVLNLSRLKNVTIALFFLTLVLSNVKSIAMYANVENIHGPQSQTSVEAFKMIQQLSEPTDVIGFIKPWTVCLFTDRKAYYPIEFKDATVIKQNNSFYEPSFYLACKNSNRKQVFNALLNKEIQNSGRYNLVWQNSDFELYEKLPN